MNLLLLTQTYNKSLMRKKLLAALFLITGLASFAQTREECSFGTVSDSTINGVNISTGGLYEYTGATDFDVPFGKLFTPEQVVINLLKGPADLPYVNINILEETEGMPAEVIQSFPQLVPASQEFAYSNEELSVYTITINLPSAVELSRGKYFLQISAAAGDDQGAWWEITNEYNQNYGAFDFSKFEDEDWGGTGYYDFVFQVSGICAESGEEVPDLGEPCFQENMQNDYETGVPFIADGMLLNIADDFIVAENTKFNVTGFKMNLLLTGGGIHNATINIRKVLNDTPGNIVKSFPNLGPTYETFHGYHAFEGLMWELVAVEAGFTFPEPVELTQGTYFIDVVPTPNATEDLYWEATTREAIGGNSFSSYDGGETWFINEGANQTFVIDGFCEDLTPVNDIETSANFSYYPNPVNDYMDIESQMEIESISIRNLTGQQVDQIKVDGKSKRISMSSYAPGIYIVKVTMPDGQTENFKLIKK